ncbi:hypothetical protein N7468_002493 [Penicillium chermesinum]|uniref:Zn(2)-C6 fungal-type domain-containing protein n=1 Tax=Penicillium chermesinum TaxID=63820 RepID=A0A9W9TXP2_9EURO|nr:uncharacterized protein N7468_002493 [Penicillium chermesinum]KAJ5247510.1 hypothetical protein N7468_002493 [Penicillium chermesinum]
MPDEKPDITVCDECGRQYTSRPAYLRHRKTHDPSKWYQCPVCRLKFPRMDVLNRHQKLHGDDGAITARDRRKRAVRACDECKKSKTRCDAARPCSACRMTDKKCSFLVKATRPSVRAMQTTETSNDMPLSGPMPESRPAQTFSAEVVIDHRSNPLIDNIVDPLPIDAFEFNVMGSDVKGQWSQTQTHLLHTFVKSFFDNFHPLWPITWLQGFEYDDVEPLLYLVMGSIGAMYMESPKAKRYGLEMHLALRPKLIAACLSCPPDEAKSDAIFEAVLLMEIMSLYLGSHEALKYTREAGAALVTHARRVRLFEESESSPLPAGVLFDNYGKQADNRLREWIKLEKRRRLVFGFFRCEIFSGVLWNTKPLVSFDELKLSLPCKQDLWTYVGPAWREKILTASQGIGSPNMVYSDLVRLVADGASGSNALALTSPSVHDLVLYGIQNWLLGICQAMQYAHSKKEEQDNFKLLQQGSDILPVQYSKISGTLERWNVSQEEFLRSFTLDPLLYHLWHVQVNANLDALHNLSSSDLYISGQSYLNMDLGAIALWATTESAHVALYHACRIWCLLDDEIYKMRTNKTHVQKPSFNILSIISIYHAGVVIWAMAHLNPFVHVDFQRGWGRPPFRLSQDNIHQWVGECASIAGQLSPSWAPVSACIIETQRLPHTTLPLQYPVF